MIEIKVVRNVILSNIDLHDQGCIVLPQGVANIFKIQRLQLFPTREIPAFGGISLGPRGSGATGTRLGNHRPRWR